MQKAIIIHGSGGNPNECWFPWLKAHLESLGFEVLVQQFPSDNENQTLENWLTVFKDLTFDENTTLIGHSLGVPFILNLLENHKFKNIYLVAGFVGLLNNQFDSVIKSFSDKQFDAEKILKNLAKVSVIYSDNDPYVSTEKSKELAKLLKTDPILIKNAGHFNSGSNYFQFSHLLDLIQKEK
jgi:predicted alpha/beta hydrolase family esterase